MSFSVRPMIPIRTLALFPAVAASALSITAMAYRYFWHNRKNDSEIGIIKPPLRHVTPGPGEQPRIVYLTGIDKETGEEELVELFSIGDGRPPIEIDASELSFMKTGGRAWALYKDAEDARLAVGALHGKAVRGCILCARLERGVEKNGTRITDKTTHTAIVRGIQRRRGTPKKKQNGINNNKTKKKKKKERTSNGAHQEDHCVVTYSHNSISVGEMEYPFPSGMYPTKLIQRLSAAIDITSSYEENQGRHQREQDRKLLRLLSDVSILGCGSVQRYAKEISEVFAMVDALERGIKLVYGLTSVDLKTPVTCYCLGDGKYPIGAAALELFLPKNNENNWKFIAIDPLLPKGDNASGESMPTCTNVIQHKNVTTVFHDRIDIFSGFSQDYCIVNEHYKPAPRGSGQNGPSQDPTETEVHEPLSIAIACHSHAPLEEFWERMPTPKLCVAMPCCAQYSELPKETPIFEYNNYEVYSPKRKIKIFSSK